MAKSKVELKLDMVSMLMGDEEFLVCVAGDDGYFKDLSDSWTNLLGYTKEELRAFPYVHFVHQDDKAETVQETAAMEDRYVESFVNRYICKDGRVAILEWSATQYNHEDQAYAVAKFLGYEKSGVK